MKVQILNKNQKKHKYMIQFNVKKYKELIYFRFKKGLFATLNHFGGVGSWQ